MLMQVTGGSSGELSDVFDLLIFGDFPHPVGDGGEEFMRFEEVYLVLVPVFLGSDFMFHAVFLK